MAFPQTPLDTKVEIYVNGTWTDITSKVYTRSPIQITRGRQDEDSRAVPGSARLVINTRDGRFSPRNPTGPYSGTIGRNTPIRASCRLGPTRLYLAGGGGGAKATAPDTAGLSITGDLDVRVDARLTSWGRSVTLGSKFTDPSQRSWLFFTDDDANLSLWWSADGSNWLTATATAPLPQTTGRQAARVTIDVDNGAGGRTITFYTASTISGTWVQVGDPVVQAGVTSIFDSTGPVAVGASSVAGVELYAAKILQGIGGTERANPDFTAQAEGTTSFVDAAGNTWTAATTSTVTNRRYRFYGEVSSWPQAWDLSGKDVWVSAEAAGILRRLAQANDPLKSAIQRFVLRSSTPAYAYWPMDDAEGSTSIASGLASGPAMTIGGSPTLAADDTFLSSNPILALNGATLTGYVNSYAATGTIYMSFAFNVPAAGDTSAVIARLFTGGGTVSRWDVGYVAGGSLTLQAFDNSGTQILTNTAAYGVNGFPAVLHVKLVQNGANIDWEYGPQSYVAGAAFSGATT